MDRCEMAKLAGERFIDNICAAAYFDGIELDFNTAYRLVRESDGMSYNLEVLLSNAMLAWNCITNTLDAEISTSYIYKLHDIISEGLSDKKSNRDRYLTNEGELEKIINSLSDVKCPIRRACGVFLNYIEFKPFDNFNFFVAMLLMNKILLQHEIGMFYVYSRDFEFIKECCDMSVLDIEISKFVDVFSDKFVVQKEELDTIKYGGCIFKVTDISDKYGYDDKKYTSEWEFACKHVSEYYDYVML